jgi:hypothetical protein
MNAVGKSKMFPENMVAEKSGLSDHGMVNGEPWSGVISLPKIRGGVVTRMTVLPVSGVISEIDIETSESSISFADEVRFDLNARINIQKIIVIGGSGMDHQ